jgi:PH/SEC7 domain-containing protein
MHSGLFHNLSPFDDFLINPSHRRLCGKLYLKAETQQVDRILEQFSCQYWGCNPDSIYGSASSSLLRLLLEFCHDIFIDIVHAVSYSLLLLNTDLHIAELATHMSKLQFVRNTMAAIQTQLQPNSASSLSPSDPIRDDSSSVRGGSDETETPASKRSDSVASWNSLTREAALFAVAAASGMNDTPSDSDQVNGNAGGQEPNHIRHGRAWETDMETLLKVLIIHILIHLPFSENQLQEMYSAIKHQQILQPTNSNLARTSTSSLSPGGAGMMRNRSLRAQPDRLTTLKRGSIRGIQSILSAQGISPYSSNSSIDGRASPSPSFATSTHEVSGFPAVFYVTGLRISR